MALDDPAQFLEKRVVPWEASRPDGPTCTATVKAQTPPGEGTISRAKSKSRKWGLFRSSSKKTRDNLASRPQRSAPDTIVGPEPTTKILARNQSYSTPSSNRRPVGEKVQRSQTDLVDRVGRRRLFKPEDSPTKQTQQLEPARPQKMPPKRTPARINFLDIDIPSVEMERYSVMFQDVLGKKPQSGLLTRRQARLSNLRSYSDQPTKGPQMHGQRQGQQSEDMTPRRSRSPLFSLFPPTPGNVGSPSSSRMRSYTCPVTPSTPSTEVYQLPEIRHRKISSQDAGDSWPRPVVEEVTSHPNLVSKFHRQQKNTAHANLDPVQLVTRSNGSQGKSEIHIKDKLRPVVVEPAWQMMTPPTSRSSTSTDLYQKRAASPQTPVDSNQGTPYDGRPSAAAKALSDAVKASITRQISQSQQQRKLILPLQNATPRRGMKTMPGGEKGTTPAVAVTMVEDERLAETRTSKPKLIHPEPMASESPRAMHRYHKSEQVILESP